MLQHVIAIAGIVISLAAADEPLLQAADAEDYNNGKYGERPTQSFLSSDLLAPRVLVNSWNQSLCSPESHLFVTLSLAKGHRAPAILSAKDLSLVWTDPQWIGGEDVRPQQYNGSTYLTFTANPHNESFIGGYGVLLDDHYDVFSLVQPDGLAGGADAHEFKVTDDGTVLMTQKHQIVTDCSAAGGPAEGCELMEGGFQEVNLATGKQKFTWLATEHVAFTEPCRPYGGGTQGFGRGWDFFHINAVSKTKTGDYIVNARHLCALMLVNGTSGEPIWQLGGKSNTFRDLSGGRATEFFGQHDARFANEDETEIIMFDNHLIGNEKQVQVHSPGCTEDCSRVRRIRLNYEEMTAELVYEWYHPLSVQARAKGGSQLLSGGGALVSWGVVPSITEFLHDGQLCMDIQFGPWSNSVSGKDGLYRAYKFDYKATPAWDPSIAVVSDKIYVSWNGATEVDTWVLFGGMTEAQMTEMAIFPKRGFETEYTNDNSLPLFVRVEARDVHGNTLRSTRTVITTPIIRSLRRH
ncbi:ASST-domain-containing protein [Microdochium trichocladiopsis]|uniref:ASST-domain-containing protein n=1 Tax=Microdochium trichocladiopsis TaxID=1682393 RepID=A0A9P9BK08_9PEZI|nr:ASST-domain-containing protein [Microdochium trichocladiopsis]KAH7026139.1 ASST-domain-containing protein [Microdochium trichocladiopsis]